MGFTRAELAALSDHDRAQLAAALAEFGPPPDVALRTPSLDAEPLRRRSRRLALLALGCAVALTAWVIGLGLNLPSDVTVRQWRLAWVGFDIAELAAFAVTGWAAWRARRWMIPATLVTGTLLLCDAWFDVVLSWGTDERWQSVITAAVLEVPLALLLWWVARRLLVAYLPPRLLSGRRYGRLVRSEQALE